MSNRFLAWFISGLAWALLGAALINSTFWHIAVFAVYVILSYWMPEALQWSEERGREFADKLFGDED